MKINVAENLKIGQRWYIKVRGAQCVSKVLITDVSRFTVLIKDTRELCMTGSRYEISDLKFIEEVYKI